MWFGQAANIYHWHWIIFHTLWNSNGIPVSPWSKIWIIWGLYLKTMWIYKAFVHTSHAHTFIHHNILHTRQVLQVHCVRCTYRCIILLIDANQVNQVTIFTWWHFVWYILVKMLLLQRVWKIQGGLESTAKDCTILSCVVFICRV